MIPKAAVFSYDPERPELQHSGECGVLRAALAGGNHCLFYEESLCVQDSFGCVLFKKKGKPR